jgi:hypothetical protein
MLCLTMAIMGDGENLCYALLWLSWVMRYIFMLCLTMVIVGDGEYLCYALLWLSWVIRNIYVMSYYGYQW